MILRAAVLTATALALVPLQAHADEPGGREILVLGPTPLSGEGQEVSRAPDPDEAYGAMVDRLLYDVTRDFRATWVRQ